MLPKSERLTKEDFARNRPKVFFRCELFDIASFPSPALRFACVIAKKTLKKSVERNSVKRKIMSAIQEILTEDNAIKKQALVFYPKKISYTASYALLVDEIKKAFISLH